MDLETAFRIVETDDSLPMPRQSDEGQLQLMVLNAISRVQEGAMTPEYCTALIINYAWSCYHEQLNHYCE